VGQDLICQVRVTFRSHFVTPVVPCTFYQTLKCNQTRKYTRFIYRFVIYITHMQVSCIPALFLFANAILLVITLVLGGLIV